MCAADWEHRSLSVVSRFSIFLLFLTEINEDEDEVKGKMRKENEKNEQRKKQESRGSGSLLKISFSRMKLGLCTPDF